MLAHICRRAMSADISWCLQILFCLQTHSIYLQMWHFVCRHAINESYLQTVRCCLQTFDILGRAGLQTPYVCRRLQLKVGQVCRRVTSADRSRIFADKIREAGSICRQDTCPTPCTLQTLQFVTCGHTHTNTRLSAQAMTYTKIKLTYSHTQYTTHLVYTI